MLNNNDAPTDQPRLWVSGGPKAEAALQFLAANPGGRVIIGHVEERAEKLLEGRIGTSIISG